MHVVAKGGKKGKGKIVVDEGEQPPISNEEAKSAAQQEPKKKAKKNQHIQPVQRLEDDEDFPQLEGTKPIVHK